MKSVKDILFCCILLAGLMTFSCKRQEETTWDAHLKGPVARGRITLGDIVPDSLLHYDENSLWHLSLSENLTDFDLDSLVQIPDTVISKKFVVPIIGGPFPFPANQVIIDVEENNLLNVNNVELREVVLKSGYLEYSVKSYIDGYMKCIYDLPGVSLNGVGTVIETTTLPSTGNDPYVHSGVIDLAGYRIDLTGENGFMSNRIFSHLTIMTAPDAPSEALISGQDSVVVELKFVDPGVHYARGYFGQHHYDLEQTIDFGEGINFPTGSLNLETVDMQMHIRNAVGVDAQLEFSALSNYNTYNGSTVNLDHAPLFEPINITRAYDNAGYVTANEYHFHLNGQNSNIDAFVENLPDQLTLQADVEVNPLGNVSGSNDFIYTDNALSATLDIDIPLAVGVSDLRFSDTLLIATTAGVDANGNLYLHVRNGFPFSATCNVSIIGESDQVLTTLLENQQIDYATETGTPGEVVAAYSVLTVPVSEDILGMFRPENRIVVDIRFNTPSYETPSKLYRDYFMDFILVGDGEVTLGFE